MDGVNAMYACISCFVCCVKYYWNVRVHLTLQSILQMWFGSGRSNGRGRLTLDLCLLYPHLWELQWCRHRHLMEQCVPMLDQNNCGSAQIRTFSNEQDADILLFSCCTNGRERLTSMLSRFRQDGGWLLTVLNACQTKTIAWMIHSCVYEEVF